MSSIVLTVEQIEDAAWDNRMENSRAEISATAFKYARAIEQAVLQSEQVQAWKKDAERYRWLRDQTWEGEICTVTKPGKHVRLGAYCPSHELLDMFVDDAAMEKQP